MQVDSTRVERTHRQSVRQAALLLARWRHEDDFVRERWNRWNWHAQCGIVVETECRSTEGFAISLHEIRD